MALDARRSLYTDLTKLTDEAAINITVATRTPDLVSLLEGISSWIDGFCHRTFQPITQARYFDIGSHDAKEKLIDDLIAVTTLNFDTNDNGTFDEVWATTDYFLKPYNANPESAWGRPYTSFIANPKSDNTQNTNALHVGVRTLEIAGTWGYSKHSVSSGDVVTEGAEYSATDVTLTVSDGSLFAIGQTIEIESELLLITNINTNDLTVVRGINGTTAATHPDSTAINILRWPPAIERATIIMAAHVWGRAPVFEPFYVNDNNDPHVRMMLEPFVKIPA